MSPDPIWGGGGRHDYTKRGGKSAVVYFGVNSAFDLMMQSFKDVGV